MTVCLWGTMQLFMFNKPTQIMVLAVSLTVNNLPWHFCHMQVSKATHFSFFQHDAMSTLPIASSWNMAID